MSPDSAVFFFGRPVQQQRANFSREIKGAADYNGPVFSRQFPGQANCFRKILLRKNLGAVTIVTADAKVYIPMDELVDKEAELKRLNKELETAQKQLDQVNAKLNNPGFTGKAPANVVEGARQNAQKLEDKIKMIASSIEALNG